MADPLAETAPSKVTVQQQPDGSWRCDCGDARPSAMAFAGHTHDEPRGEIVQPAEGGLVPEPTVAECIETLRRLVFSDVPEQEKTRAFATALALVGQARDHADGLPLCTHRPNAKAACRSYGPHGLPPAPKGTWA